MAILRRFVTPFVLALVVGLASALLITYKVELPFATVLVYLPYVLFALAAFLGFQLNQSRIFFAAAMLALCYGALTAGLPVTTAQRAQAIALTVPPFFAASFAFRESRLFGGLGLLRIAGLVIPLGALLAGAALKATPVTDFLGWQWLFFLKSWRLADLSLIFLAIMAVLLIYRGDRYMKDFSLSLTLGLLSFFFMLNHVAGAGAAVKSGAFFGATGLATILLAALFRLYWQKVYIDELSGIPNRRALNEKLETLEGNYCIAMGDIDFFKKFNDSYGHDEGDNVIRFVAKHLDLGSGARAYRYGGEEFCLVFDDLGPDDVLELLERLRKALADSKFVVRGKNLTVSVTISIGVSRKSKDRTTPEAVIHDADKALYEAKKNGRNCVVFTNR